MVPLNQHIWNILKNWMSFPIAIGDPWARFLREWGPAHRYLARGLDNSGIPEEETKTTSGDPARARHVWNKTWEATHLVVISKESITSKNWNKHSQNRCTGPCFCFIEDGLFHWRWFAAHSSNSRTPQSQPSPCKCGNFLRLWTEGTNHGCLYVLCLVSPSGLFNVLHIHPMNIWHHLFRFSKNAATQLETFLFGYSIFFLNHEETRWNKHIWNFHY